MTRSRLRRPSVKNPSARAKGPHPECGSGVAAFLSNFEHSLLWLGVSQLVVDTALRRRVATPRTRHRRSKSELRHYQPLLSRN